MNIKDIVIEKGHFENEDGTHTDTNINCAKLFETKLSEH